jgi:hypothetical protein
VIGTILFQDFVGYLKEQEILPKGCDRVLPCARLKQIENLFFEFPELIAFRLQV